MSRTPLPLSASFDDTSFDVAAAYRAGLSPGILRHRRFAAPHRGLRSTRAPLSSGAFLSERIERLAQTYRPLLRTDAGEAFSHTTALVLLGAPIVAAEELHVTIPAPFNAVRRPQVRGHTSNQPLPRANHALPCVAPECALIQSAPLLPFRELVIAVDHFLAPRGPYEPRVAMLDREVLRAACEASRHRGVFRLRAALEVSRAGAESRGESMLHFEMAAMGIDDLELQGVVRDADGRRIGRFDGVDRARRRILEFDGEQHRTDRTQYLKDLGRAAALDELGYRQRRFHTGDFSPGRLPATRRTICAFLGVSPRPVSRYLARYFGERYC